MTAKDSFIALLIAVVWGFNFVPMKWGMEFLSPMMLGAVRFFLVAFPLVFFVKIPKVPFIYIAFYAIGSTFLQFIFVFLSIAIGLSVGIASVILQTQAIFTIIFGVFFLGERPTKRTIFSLVIAFLGLIFIGLSSDNKNAPLTGVIFCILGAAFWGAGNITIRKIINKGYCPDMLSMMVWSSVLLPIPFIVSSLIFEEKQINIEAFNMRILFAILFLAYVSSIFGYTAWSKLLSRYDAGIVAPYSLLVPGFGILFSHIFFKDDPSPLQWLGIITIFAGLVIYVLGSRRKKTKKIQ